MENQFVKKPEKGEVLTVIDGDLPNSAFISVVPDGEIPLIDIVIGAEYKDRCSCRFSKNSVKELINILQEIHDVME